MIEAYKFPLWILSSQAKNADEYKTITIYTEAVSFWMFRLSTSISDHLNSLRSAPVEICLEFEQEMLLVRDSVIYANAEPFTGEIELTVEQNVITILIPFSLVGLFSAEDNLAEKLIMKVILTGFNVLLRKSGKEQMTNAFIDQVIDETLSPSNAKMILFSDSSSNPLLDNRDLVPVRYLMDTEKELIADHLISMLNPAKPIPEMIEDTKEKNKLCMTIVGTLLVKVEEKLSVFRADKLLEYLVRLNESLIFQSEYNSLLLPSKIACYSNFEAEVKDVKKKDGKIVPTSLAVRGIIEFVAASPTFGSEPVNLDQIDEIIALMNEAIFWANLADSIELLGNDPKVGLLPSGRIGVLDNFYELVLKPFNNSRAETEVHYAIHPDKQEDKFDEGDVFVNNEVTDAAFKSEWGVSFTTITALFGSLQMLGMQNGSSFMSMKESDFFAEVPKLFRKPVDEQELKIAINLFILDKRKSIKKAPDGFIAKDILPWRYNRALSFVRRPVIRITYPGDDQPTYHWGFRHVLRSYMQLTALISSGKIKVAKEGQIESKVISIFVKHSGKKYRNEVFKWLKENTNLRLIDHEVTITENGHLVADINYGDVDIMAIDDVNKIIYSIECKNTASARVVHEMKTELDSYIGQNGEGGHILKHSKRHKWLSTHQDQLVKYVDKSDDYRIVSFVLSSNVIPVVYLAKNKAALPIRSFRDLVRNGFETIARDLNQ
ncbi:hypothetical protein [Pedobacter jamesrossensis]|uniref:PD-(D/E)XK nuclease superfamily protein n=1 Tax=Pedobacter jamesrossensis TaxID=1908238 RepID=A0ABV8NLV7_9SPHI